MATVTITFDGRNSKARWFLDLLFSTGLFTQKDGKPNKRSVISVKKETRITRMDTDYFFFIKCW